MRFSLKFIMVFLLLSMAVPVLADNPDNWRIPTLSSTDLLKIWPLNRHMALDANALKAIPKSTDASYPAYLDSIVKGFNPVGSYETAMTNAGFQLDMYAYYNICLILARSQMINETTFLTSYNSISHPALWNVVGNDRVATLGKWTLISTNNAPWRLYDTALDPSHSVDFASQYPKVVSAYTRILLKWDYLQTHLRDDAMKQYKANGGQITVNKNK